MTDQASTTFGPAGIRLDLASLRETYACATPYPHVQVDEFIDPMLARAAMDAFPAVADRGWIHYVHVNERKHGLNKIDLIPDDLRAVIERLNSPEFVATLCDLTGIPDLVADDMLEGGGLHQTERGGFLNVHADFTVHPHRRNWRRRVNLLLYLNDGWLDEYAGHLELWDREMTACAKRVSPVFNRAVIFNTDADSYHGVPSALLCPAGTTRKSIALYYFTEEAEIPRLRTTNYRARPGQDKRFLIWLDRSAIATYTRVKRRFGIDDGLISKALNRRKH